MQIEYSNFQHRTGELRGIPETCPAHIRALITEKRSADARKRGIVVEPVALHVNELDETDALLAAALSL